ncbi:MAG: adenylate cyclase [Gammaproteobacteria bacterium]|nr:MAG: adenylate cyclase [Gammaproteobacteria bacterium]
MGTEIERKFLVTSDDWRAEARAGAFYRQGYLSSVESCSIRVRVSDKRAFLNIKSATLSVTRTEYEYPLPLEDAREILDHLCAGPLIEKTRYFVPHGGFEWEVDVFEGDNQGLVVAEIELESADQAFDKPAWVGNEVSEDARYYNVCLTKHPFKDWPGDDKR